MTTLRDLTRDLVIEAMTSQILPELTEARKQSYIDYHKHEIDDLVDEFIQTVETRLIGE